MKTIKYYHKNSDVMVFKKIENSDGSWSEYTYDEKGNSLTYKSSSGYWVEYTYNEGGKQLTFKNSNGYWSERTYDEKGNQLNFKDYMGYWYEFTYDEKGNELTYKNSKGIYQIKGKSINKEGFEQFTYPKPCLGKKVVVDGVEYILS